MLGVVDTGAAPATRGACELLGPVFALKDAAFSDGDAVETAGTEGDSHSVGTNGEWEGWTAGARARARRGGRIADDEAGR